MTPKPGSEFSCEICAITALGSVPGSCSLAIDHKVCPGWTMILTIWCPPAAGRAPWPAALAAVAAASDAIPISRTTVLVTTRRPRRVSRSGAGRPPAGLAPWRAAGARPAGPARLSRWPWPGRDAAPRLGPTTAPLFGRNAAPWFGRMTAWPLGRMTAAGVSCALPPITSRSSGRRPPADAGTALTRPIRLATVAFTSASNFKCPFDGTPVRSIRSSIEQAPIFFVSRGSDILATRRTDVWSLRGKRLMSYP